jgi:DNA-binding CsgD family transcriptional regulator
LHLVRKGRKSTVAELLAIRLPPSASLVPEYVVVSRSGNAAGHSQLSARSFTGPRSSKNGSYVAIAGRTADVGSVSSPVEGRPAVIAAGRAMRAASAGTHGISPTNAATVVLFTLGLILLRAADPEDAVLFLLVLPIWLVSRDQGWVAGFAACVGGLLVIAILQTLQEVTLEPLAFMAQVAVFAGAVAAGSQARLTREDPAAPEHALVRLLTVKPEVSARPDVLSSRELEVLETIATGAKNSQIADRFVISENTVKSHVKQILKKLAVANRTEAAYRYIEWYGRPHPVPEEGAEDDSNAHAPASHMAAASAARAKVSATPKDDRVGLTLQDGQSLEVPLLDPVSNYLKIGVPAIVYFDRHDRAVGWYLPEVELGVDMRHWTP